MGSLQFILHDTSLKEHCQLKTALQRKSKYINSRIKVKVINDNYINWIKNSLSRYLSKEEFVYTYIETSCSRAVRENFCQNNQTVVWNYNTLLFLGPSIWRKPKPFTTLKQGGAKR